MRRPDSFVGSSFFKNSIIEIRDKKGVENVVADHLSRIPNSPCNELPINEDFPDENLLAIFREPWFADIVNYLVTN